MLIYDAEAVLRIWDHAIDAPPVGSYPVLAGSSTHWLPKVTREEIKKTKQHVKVFQDLLFAAWSQATDIAPPSTLWICRDRTSHQPSEAATS